MRNLIVLTCGAALVAAPAIAKAQLVRPPAPAPISPYVEQDRAVVAKIEAEVAAEEARLAEVAEDPWAPAGVGIGVDAFGLVDDDEFETKVYAASIQELEKIRGDLVKKIEAEVDGKAKAALFAKLAGTQRQILDAKKRELAAAKKKAKKKSCWMPSKNSGYCGFFPVRNAATAASFYGKHAELFKQIQIEGSKDAGNLHAEILDAQAYLFRWDASTTVARAADSEPTDPIPSSQRENWSRFVSGLGVLSIGARIPWLYAEVPGDSGTHVFGYFAVRGGMNVDDFSSKVIDEFNGAADVSVALDAHANISDKFMFSGGVRGSLTMATSAFADGIGSARQQFGTVKLTGGVTVANVLQLTVAHIPAWGAPESLRSNNLTTILFTFYPTSSKPKQ